MSTVLADSCFYLGMLIAQEDAEAVFPTSSIYHLTANELIAIKYSLKHCNAVNVPEVKRFIARHEKAISARTEEQKK